MKKQKLIFIPLTCGAFRAAVLFTHISEPELRHEQKLHDAQKKKKKKKSATIKINTNPTKLGKSSV